jgi:hypothetical protein
MAARPPRPRRAGLADRILDRFNAWFASPAGVWQTLAIVLGIAVAEKIFPHLDPSMFALMAWLTIYSAVTQPALACVGAEAAARLEALEQRAVTILAGVESTEGRLATEIALLKADLALTQAMIRLQLAHMGVQPPEERPT